MKRLLPLGRARQAFLKLEAWLGHDFCVRSEVVECFPQCLAEFVSDSAVR